MCLLKQAFSNSSTCFQSCSPSKLPAVSSPFVSLRWSNENSTWTIGCQSCFTETPILQHALWNRSGIQSLEKANLNIRFVPSQAWPIITSATLSRCCLSNFERKATGHVVMSDCSKVRSVAGQPPPLHRINSIIARPHVVGKWTLIHLQAGGL